MRKIWDAAWPIVVAAVGFVVPWFVPNSFFSGTSGYSGSWARWTVSTAAALTLWAIAQTYRTHRIEQNLVIAVADIASVKRIAEELVDAVPIVHDLIGAERKFPGRHFATKYLGERLDDLHKQAQTLKGQGRIVVEGTHLPVRQLLLTEFCDAESDVLRYLHFCNDTEYMFSELSREYFRLVEEQLEKGTIRLIKRLFVYAEDSELTDDLYKLLASYHVTKPKYSCSRIPKRRLDTIRLRIAEEFHDFGIYGERALYLNKDNRFQTNMATRNGVYVVDANVILTFKSFFEEAWAAGEEIDTAPMTNVDDIPQDLGALFDAGRALLSQE